MPDNTSPVPAVASDGVPLVTKSTFPVGAAITVTGPFSKTVTPVSVATRTASMSEFPVGVEDEWHPARANDVIGKGLSGRVTTDAGADDNGSAPLINLITRLEDDFVGPAIQSGELTKRSEANH